MKKCSSIIRITTGIDILTLDGKKFTSSWLDVLDLGEIELLSSQQLFWIQNKNSVVNTLMFWVFVYPKSGNFLVSCSATEEVSKRNWEGAHLGQVTRRIFRTIECHAQYINSYLEEADLGLGMGVLAWVSRGWAIVLCVNYLSLNMIITVILHNFLQYFNLFSIIKLFLFQHKGFILILLLIPLR